MNRKDRSSKGQDNGKKLLRFPPNRSESPAHAFRERLNYGVKSTLALLKPRVRSLIAHWDRKYKSRIKRYLAQLLILQMDVLRYSDVPMETKARITAGYREQEKRFLISVFPLYVALLWLLIPVLVLLIAIGNLFALRRPAGISSSIVLLAFCLYGYFKHCPYVAEPLYLLAVFFIDLAAKNLSTNLHDVFAVFAPSIPLNITLGIILLVYACICYFVLRTFWKRRIRNHVNAYLSLLILFTLDRLADPDEGWAELATRSTIGQTLETVARNTERSLPSGLKDDDREMQMRVRHHANEISTGIRNLKYWAHMPDADSQQRLSNRLIEILTRLITVDWSGMERISVPPLPFDRSLRVFPMTVIGIVVAVLPSGGVFLYSSLSHLRPETVPKWWYILAAIWMIFQVASVLAQAKVSVPGDFIEMASGRQNETVHRTAMSEVSIKALEYFSALALAGAGILKVFHQDIAIWTFFVSVLFFDAALCLAWWRSSQNRATGRLLIVKATFVVVALIAFVGCLEFRTLLSKP